MLMGEMRAAEVTADEIDKITYANSCQFSRWDPFALVPRERATVGAPKALARDVDLTVRASTEYRARYEAHLGGAQR